MNPRQKFLEHALAVGLDCGTITTADVTKHCSPEVLAQNLPPDLKMKLLQACLDAPKMDADLIVDVIGTQAFAENIPMNVVWKCVADAAARALGDASVSANATNATKGAAKTASASASKSKSTPLKKKAAKSKAPAKELPKPPAKGDGKAAKPAAAAAKSKAAGAPAKDAAAKTKGVAAGTNRTKVPRNEFDVDTDVGEDVVDDWDDDIVEVVEEDVIGASTSVLDEIASEGGVSDWSRDEETVTRDVNKR